MAISDNQKIDYLFKKVGLGSTKTDTVFNKLAANESIPSPLLIRGDTIWAASGTIPSVKPAVTTDAVLIRTAIETTEDITATGNRTWKTGIIDWIPTEFGSTYLVNVYIHTAGDAANAEDISNKVFTTGSGNNDEWFFDYQSGVLNFIGDNLPNGISFVGKSVYISGATYAGAKGVASAAISQDISALQAQVASILTNTDPAALDSLTEIVNAFQAADGTFATSTELADINIAIRSDLALSVSDITGQITTLETTLRSDLSLPVANYPVSQNWIADGATTLYTLNYPPANADAIDVYVNDVLQRPGGVYALQGLSTLQFLEVPPSGYDIYVKFRTSMTTAIGIPNNSVEARHLNLVYTSTQHVNNDLTTVYTIPTGHTVHSVFVIIQGLIITPSQYTIAGSTLTLNAAPANPSTVDIRYLPI
jgi:hypothetical protein